MPRAHVDSVNSAVPMFFLYGEPRQTVSPRFLHLETLEARSRPGDWTIRPHAHADLHHLFLIVAGAGNMQADGRVLPFAAPCLLTMPLRVVHGFSWQPETQGHVLTLSEGYLKDLRARAPSLGALFASPLALHGADVEGFGASLNALGRELAWSAPGHEAAVDAHLLMLLVGALRHHDQALRTVHQPAGRAAELVARFRALVEARYRDGQGVDDYARALGTAPRTLRRACTVAARSSPAEIVQDRIFLEAQRILLYTSMTVSEAAAHLGFQDFAYFSRFFARRAGESATSFRRKRKAHSFS
jgi:AraC family transcriptional activator of pobA